MSEITPFEPKSLEEAMTLSKTLATCNVLAPALRQKPADVLFIIMTGRELGLSVSQSLRSIHLIEGKPSMSADLVVGLCVKRRELCEYFRPVESTGKVATYETKRTGSEPVRLSFTLEQARQANLLGKGNWKNYPDAMLRARASMALARAVYPDIAMGLYDPDELDAPRLHAVPTERDVTPPLAATGTAEATPTEAPALPPPSRTEALKGQLRARQQEAARTIRVVNVADGQTEEEAERLANAKVVSPPPSRAEWGQVWEQIQAIGERFGKRGLELNGVIRDATGKGRRGELDADDVARVEAALSTLAQIEKASEDEAL